MNKFKRILQAEKRLEKELENLILDKVYKCKDNFLKDIKGYKEKFKKFNINSLLANTPRSSRNRKENNEILR